VSNGPEQAGDSQARRRAASVSPFST
jgi:hypothetical protein